MSCDFCLDGIMPGATICAASISAVPALDHPGARPPQLESRTWFGELALNPHGIETPPDSPPPR